MVSTSHRITFSVFLSLCVGNIYVVAFNMIFHFSYPLSSTAQTIYSLHSEKPLGVVNLLQMEVII